MRRKNKAAGRVRPSRRQVSFIEMLQHFYAAKRSIFLVSFLVIPIVVWNLGGVHYALDKAGSSGHSLLAKAGFVVQEVLVEGRNQTDVKTILSAVGALRGNSIFACDPVGAKERLEKITWIQSATVQRRLPDTIYIRLVERHPIAIWQQDKKKFLIDEHGSVIENFDPQQFKDMLVVTGAKAPENTKDLLDGFKDFPELRQKIKSAVFISGRRWDLIMINNVRVKLPEKNIQPALTHLERLEKEHRLTDGRVATIDLRLPDRSFLYVQESEDDKKNKGKIT
jgi:cell division protein FtsQ